MNGGSDRTKEYIIDVEVFDRGPSFDPRVDPVVRVEARRLRTKLEKWHDTQGHDSEILIELPTGAYSAVFRRRNEPAQTNSAPATHKTVAVLPFANLNRDPELDYFSDGLTEELIHALTRVSGLHVFAWPSALRMKNEQQDIAAIRDRLHVEHIEDRP